MNNMYEILSDNLVRLRKSRNLTQAEFAEIIKYSDKSVSKWETGMSIPNLETLLEIADYYGMTIDDLVRKPVDNEKVEVVEKIKKNNKFSIILLSISAIFLISTIVFVFSIINKKTNTYWTAYIWALPISSLLLIYFSKKWNKKYIYVALSALNWTMITAIFLQFSVVQNWSAHLWLLYIVGIPVQIIIILLRGLRKDIVEENAERQSIVYRRRQERRRSRKKDVVEEEKSS